jgi:Ala-tRNA(Pro) deacylase
MASLAELREKKRLLDAQQKQLDEDIKKDEYIGVHPCINTSTLKIKTSDMFDKITDALGHNYMTVNLVGEVE